MALWRWAKQKGQGEEEKETILILSDAWQGQDNSNSGQSLRETSTVIKLVSRIRFQKKRRKKKASIFITHLNLVIW